jgi:hypothetical protein
MARYKIRTPAELRRIARAQTSQEVTSELAPYRGQQRDVTTRKGRALEDLNSLYGGLQTFAQQSAARTQGLQQQSYGVQNQLFEQASSRLDQFRQQRAADAQALAQQVGGPVPMSAFTEGVDAGSVMPHAAAGALMSALSAGADASSEAESFAGRIFPMVQGEETQKTRNQYDDQIANIQDEIAKIKSSRQGRQTARYNELLTQEREYEMNKTRADRDYAIAKGTLGISKRAQDLSEKQFSEMSAAEKANYRLQQRQTAIAEHKDKAVSTEEDEAINMLDALTSPGEFQDVKSVSYPQVGYMSPRQAAKKGYFTMDNDTSTKNGMRMYYKQQTSTQTMGGEVKIDPATQGAAAYGEAYKYLVAHGYRQQLAARLVRQYFDLGSGWTPPPAGKNPWDKRKRGHKTTRPPKPKLPGYKQREGGTGKPKKKRR